MADTCLTLLDEARAVVDEAAQDQASGENEGLYDGGSDRLQYLEGLLDRIDRALEGL